jgi:hypothetical protein
LRIISHEGSLLEAIDSQGSGYQVDRLTHNA